MMKSRYDQMWDMFSSCKPQGLKSSLQCQTREFSRKKYIDNYMLKTFISHINRYSSFFLLIRRNGVITISVFLNRKYMLHMYSFDVLSNIRYRMEDTSDQAPKIEMIDSISHI